MTPATTSSQPMRVGLISDTHGLLRPQALALLRGADHIVHAGDIGAPDILAALARIAPVTAVRGNNDRGAWAEGVPVTAMVQVGAATLYAIHDVAELDLDPEAAGVAAVIAGHSHRPACERRGAVLFVNPGSAGPRRFTLPVAVGELLVRGRAVEARLIVLDV